MHASNTVDIVPPDNEGEASGSVYGEIKGPTEPEVPPIVIPDPDDPDVPVVPDKPIGPDKPIVPDIPLTPEKPSQSEKPLTPSTSENQTPQVSEKAVMHFIYREGRSFKISQSEMQEAMTYKRDIEIDVYDENNEDVLKYRVLIHGKDLTNKDIKDYHFDLSGVKTHEEYLRQAYKDNKDIMTFCICPFESLSFDISIQLKVDDVNQKYYVYGYDVKAKETKLLNKNVEPDKEGFIYVKHKKGYDYLVSIDELKTPLSKGSEVENKENDMMWLILVCGGLSIVLISTGLYLGIKKKHKEDEISHE